MERKGRVLSFPLSIRWDGMRERERERELTDIFKKSGSSGL